MEPDWDEVTASGNSASARVLVVDDSSAFLDAAAALVSAAPSLRLVGVAASGEDALELLPELKPDLVLLDIHMPRMDGVETARIIRTDRPEAVVVLVSAEPAGFEAAGRAAGAVAVLDKRRLAPGTLEELWAEHRREP
jgi:two-component system chemotaxis response regulator CheB